MTLEQEYKDKVRNLQENGGRLVAPPSQAEYAERYQTYKKMAEDA